MKKNTAIILVVAVAVVAFGVGYFMARAQAPAAQQNGQGQFSRRQFGGNGANGQTLFSGQVSSIESSSITLQLPQGQGSRVVVYSPSVQVRKTVSGSLSDVTSGTNVTVIGSTNSDGSVTAQDIQIRQPGDFPGGGRMGGGQQPGTNTPAGQ